MWTLSAARLESAVLNVPHCLNGGVFRFTFCPFYRLKSDSGSSQSQCGNSEMWKEMPAFCRSYANLWLRYHVCIRLKVNVAQCIAARRATVWRSADKFRVLISQHWLGISDRFPLQPVRLLETFRLVGYYYYYCYHHHHYHHNHLLYTYVPETNYVPREYSVAAVLLLIFMVLISLVSVLNLLYFYISTFRHMCAVPNRAVFWSSLTSCFPDMLLTYFLNDLK